MDGWRTPEEDAERRRVWLALTAGHQRRLFRAHEEHARDPSGSHPASPEATAVLLLFCWIIPSDAHSRLMVSCCLRSFEYANNNDHAVTTFTIVIRIQFLVLPSSTTRPNTQSITFLINHPDEAER